MPESQKHPQAAPKLNQATQNLHLEDDLRRVRSAIGDILGELPENAEWNQIVAIHKFAAACIKEGRKQRIPETYLRRFGHEFLKDKIKGGHYRVVANFMENMKFGTQRDINYFKLLADAQEKGIQNQIKAMESAEGFKEITLELHSQATMADLFQAMDALPDPMYVKLIDTLFNQLGDYYSYFTDLRSDKEAASGVRIIDFFDAYIDPEDPTDLPVPITWITSAEWEKRQKEIKKQA